ncbi:ArpU family phage packaging/lysis transcriptional regulator [Lapidilactobacillus luobeiensis]|uniref:ArpU family phage packaging/lysis transcriptional regulator n=1 Tax=Lapidilactobacillus luobeiensis TaxID=2950371 RepID=UPI0021C26790|nr:ArpU family phage packaging/lysis transcriptional regulator [Lapidilactobacillus luobeiensis]
MGLLPEIDVRASREMARDLLSQYPRLTRIAGVRLIDLQSPTIDGMPKIQQYGNRIENKMVEHIDAVTIIDNIQQAMQILRPTSYWVLYYSYFVEVPLTYEAIAGKLVGYSGQTIDYLKKRALLEFAEAYPGEELLVFE